MIFLSAFALPVTHRLPFRGFPGTSVSSLLSSVLKKGGRHAIDSFGKNHCSFSSSVEISEFEYDGFHDDGKSTEKDAALHLALSQLSGEFDRESPLSLRRFFGIRRVPVISTGSLKLDLALGIGGLPKGRFVEIYGLEASGKTTLALHIIKEAQKVGGVCAYFDVENAIDPFLAESMGVDTQSLLISHPNSAENLLSAVDTLTKSGSVDVIVVDSVRFGSKSSEGIEYIDEYTCGGNALKFYAAIRLRLKKTGLRETENKEVTGLGISVQVVKNKLAPAMKKAELRLQFGRGFCCESEVLELACKHGVIVKEGNNYLIEGKVFSNEHAAEKHLAENDVIFDKLVSILRRLLFETK
ncbi:DNA repair protein recA homolog 2, mitochondrial isoform X4 [Humulus lupulus]|uniref:DNA repair protein recA homolog 2, mitochondrial isoform X4 n=1 Tax=Humulus lupulus TaxID=3486 RepID=UPI002B404E03|nr:DNA repair protein recA homolog 2, mitochondrial isoform X4 [Humulus lupulus]